MLLCSEHTGTNIQFKPVSLDRLPRGDGIPRQRIHHLTFAIFTILPFACGSFGSLTTVTYNSFSPSVKATLVVPSPAAISNVCRSLPSGDIFKILPPNQFSDESVVVDLPKFVAADSNAFSVCWFEKKH